MAVGAQRVDMAAAWIAGLVVAVPLVALRYPPMPDLAMHEATVAILRRLHDASFVPAGLYTVVAPQANQLFHFLACGLSFVVATDTACKLLVAATTVLIVVAMARLLVRAGRSAALAPLVVLVALGWSFRWGLVANLLGFGLLLLFLPLLLEVDSGRTRRVMALSLAASVVLAFAHLASALAFAIVAVALFVLAFAARSPRRPPWRALVPAVAVAVLVGAQSLLTTAMPELVGASMTQTGSAYGLGPVDRLLILPGAVFGGGTPTTLAIESAFCLVALAGAAWLRSRAPADVPFAARHRFAFLAAAFFALYLLFPMALGGSTLLAHRFLPPAFACLLVAVSPAATASPPALSRLLRLFALLAAPLVVLLMWPGFVAADRRARDLDVVLAAMPDDTSVAQLDLTPRPPGLVAPVPGLAARAQAVHGGRMLFAFVDQPPNPLYIRPELRWNEPVERLTRMPFAFLPAVDGHRFAYLLVLETDPQAESLVPEALTPEYEPVRAAGQWQLFRSTLAVDPLDSPDRPLTEPPRDTLARRLNALLQSGRR